MLLSKSFSRLSLFTTSIISYFFVTNLPAKAATFSFSEPILVINNFSVSPQNPSVESHSITVTSSRDELDLAKAKAEVNTTFQADSDSAFLNTNLFSDAYGAENRFFGLGESSSLAVGKFAIDAGHILSFNFVTALTIFNQVDSPLEGSASGFSSVNFLVKDDYDNSVLADFTAIGSVNTNVKDNVNEDFILVDSNNVSFAGSKYEDFAEQIELAELFVQGSFAQSFPQATNVRLEVAVLSRSCVQASITKDPCTKVPESDSTITLIFGCLGLGLVSKFTRKT